MTEHHHLPSAVVDHLDLGSGSSERRWAVYEKVTRVMGALLVLGIGTIGLAFAPAMWRDGAAMERATSCTQAQLDSERTDACLVETRGYISGPRGSGKWAFQPNDPGTKEAIVRLDDDQAANSRQRSALSRLLQGEVATALYWDGRPVAFVISGERLETRRFGTGTFVLEFYFFAAMFVLGVFGSRVVFRRP